MKRPGWSSRVFLRYALWQLPGFTVFVVTLLLVSRWANLPRWLVWIGVILWVVKDLFFFPRVWRAYDSDPSRAAHSMVGKKGIVETPLRPSGLVRVHGEVWRAEARRGSLPVGAGETVRIEEVRGLTLIVHPDRDGVGIEPQGSKRAQPDQGNHGSRVEYCMPRSARISFRWDLTRFITRK